jgi:nicotinamidase-related amidase
VVKYDPVDTAVVVIDPQNDVLSPNGKNWALLQAGVTENGTVEHLIAIFTAAKAHGFGVFISPHYFFPTDHTWLFNGPLESDELSTNTFARVGALSLDGFAASGADWLDEFKPFIEYSATVVASPHKVWGPQTNDLVLQLRKRRISKLVVRDATAGPRHPTRGDGYQAALVNYAFLAHAVAYTDEVVAAMKNG